jgi:hypothetical protein
MRNYSVRALAIVATVAFLVPIVARAGDVTPQERAWETRLGDQRYDELERKGEIVPPQSPLYAMLQPVAARVAAVADRQYFAPFHFYVVDEPTPNAFSVPGGNVYVTTSLLAMIRNRDELAGVLCHEVNHDIHHDVYNFYRQGKVGPAEAARQHRIAETNADRAGAYTCAKAGFNPWGMVWSFRDYQEDGISSRVTTLSDHPSDASRVAALTTLIEGDSSTFGRFRDDVAAAPPTPRSYGPTYGQVYPQMQTYAQVARPGYAPPAQAYPQQPVYPQQMVARSRGGACAAEPTRRARRLCRRARLELRGMGQF